MKKRTLPRLFALCLLDLVAPLLVATHADAVGIETPSQLLDGAGATLAAQSQVFLVGPRFEPGVDFIQISDAIAAATDGDIIRVLPSPESDYAAFVIDGKGVSILAVDSEQRSGLATPTIQNLTQAQTVRIVGFPLDVLPGTLLLENNAGTVHLTQLQMASLKIENSTGPTWIQDSSIVHDASLGAGLHALEVLFSKRVTIQDCRLQGGTAGHSLMGVKSTIYAYGSSFEAPITAATGAAGSDCAVVDQRSLFFAKNCSMTGGDAIDPSGACSLPGGFGVTVMGRSKIGFKDCTIRGGLEDASCTTNPAQSLPVNFVNSGGRQSYSSINTEMSVAQLVRSGDRIRIEFKGRPFTTVTLFGSGRTVNNYMEQLVSTLYLPASVLTPGSGMMLGTVLLDQAGEGSITLRSPRVDGTPLADMYLQALYLTEFPGVPTNLTFSTPRKLLILGESN